MLICIGEEYLLVDGKNYQDGDRESKAGFSFEELTQVRNFKM